jgi:hypothetical protein
LSRHAGIEWWNNDRHSEQAFFAPRGIRASRAKGHVLCDPIIARLARFLIELRHYQE